MPTTLQEIGWYAQEVADGNQPGTTRLPAIRTRELTRRFGACLAVDRVSLDIPPQGNFGLLGPNGAGKSTLIKMLTTLLPPTAGRAWVTGLDIGREASQVRGAIGYVPQMLSADGALTSAMGVGTDLAVLLGVSVCIVAAAAKMYPRMIT